MKRTWTIIGVRDVASSLKWYQSLFGQPETAPGHDYFGQIVDSDGTVLLCLHQWGAHEHPTLISPDMASPGNGLLLFFRVDDYEMALKRARALVDRFEEEPHVNPNTQTWEFSIRDLDGYYVTISADRQAAHIYENTRHDGHCGNCVFAAWPFDDASSEDSAARDLAAAKSLAFGGVGVAGLMSEGERNLRAILDRPDASKQLQAALAHATPAGTLYILVGLRRCDRAAYQTVLDSLARSSDDVEVVRGCMISQAPFRQGLSQVEDGRFDEYLSRPR